MFLLGYVSKIKSVRNQGRLLSLRKHSNMKDGIAQSIITEQYGKLI